MERIIVLGLGNILYGDEGFGVRVAERLYSRYAFPDNVEIVDAGTQGHPLLAFVERATRLLLLDAVDFGLPAGNHRREGQYRHPGLFERAQDEPTPEQLFRSAGPCGAEGLPPGGNPADRSPASGHDLWKHAEPLLLSRLDTLVDMALLQLQAWGVPGRPACPESVFQNPEISLERYVPLSA